MIIMMEKVTTPPAGDTKRSSGALNVYPFIDINQYKNLYKIIKIFI